MSPYPVVSINAAMQISLVVCIYAKEALINSPTPDIFCVIPPYAVHTRPCKKPQETDGSGSGKSHCQLITRMQENGTLTDDFWDRCSNE